MASDVLQDPSGGVAALARDLSKGLPEPDRAPRRMQVSEVPADQAARLPRSIAGGFRGVGEDLDRRAREWRSMVRLLQQQGPQFESAEAERAKLYEQLSRIVAEVQESGRTLKGLLDTTRSGDASGNLAAGFARNLGALDELENVAEALASNLVSVRSSWEQYARAVIRAQKMREDLKQDLGERRD